MHKTKISFIIPMFNEEATIKLCLDAIASEMHEDDEVIIVDNGSSDNSVSITKSYRNVQLLEKPGMNIGALRNIGAMSAKGDILAFIDADCVICCGWRNHVVNTLINQEVACCGSKYELPVNACWIEKAWFSQKRMTTGVVSYINSGNLAIKKNIFTIIGGFNDQLITGEDAELGLRLNLSGFVVMDNPNVKAIHLGNPKDLWNFYKKQRWHGMGMFGTLNISWFDKPFILTIMFICCSLFALMSITIPTINCGIYSPLIALMAVFIVPIITSIYRCFQYKNLSYFPHLVLLYLLYFMARSNALVLICYNSLSKLKGNI